MTACSPLGAAEMRSCKAVALKIRQSYVYALFPRACDCAFNSRGSACTYDMCVCERMPRASLFTSEKVNYIFAFNTYFPRIFLFFSFAAPLFDLRDSIPALSDRLDICGPPAASDASGIRGQRREHNPSDILVKKN